MSEGDICFTFFQWAAMRQEVIQNVELIALICFIAGWGICELLNYIRSMEDGKSVKPSGP